MEIRVMREADAAGAYSLVCDSLDEYFAPQVISFFRMQWPAGQIVACDPFGHILGYIAGARLPNGNVSISLFCVEKDLRGKGIGTMLLNRFRQSAIMDGARNIQLEVKEHNSSAREFYRKNGFMATERLENFYNDGSSGVRMICSINSSSHGFHRIS